MPILSQQKQSQAPDFPNLRPSLDLRFALAKKLDPRITFTRGSTGTYFGPDGLMKTAGVNEPRFDHDPVTGQSLGLLIEESRQNLLTYSEDFGTGWFKGDGSVSTNLITAPDGNTTADAFIENTLTNKFHYINLTLSKSASSIQYTGSCWIKDKGRQVLMNLQSGASNGVVCRFQPATGQMVVSPVAFGTGWTAGSFSVVPYPNGWYRVSMTATSDTLTTVVFQLATYNTAISSNVYTGDGTSGLYIWGAQVEAGAFPTSYIPTTASTVTRSADNASMTGTNFSSWYNQSEGTIVISTDKLYSGNYDVYRHFYDINSGTTQDEITSYAIPSGTVITNYGISNNGRQIFDYVQVNIGSSPTRFKIGQSLNAKYSFFATSKGITTPQLSSKSSPNGQNLSIPTNMIQLSIGCQYASSSFGKYINSHIDRLTYYPIQVTNQQLINLAS